MQQMGTHMRVCGGARHPRTQAAACLQPPAPCSLSPTGATETSPSSCVFRGGARVQRPSSLGVNLLSIWSGNSQASQQALLPERTKLAPAWLSGHDLAAAAPSGWNVRSWGGGGGGERQGWGGPPLRGHVPGCTAHQDPAFSATRAVRPSVRAASRAEGRARAGREMGFQLLQ